MPLHQRSNWKNATFIFIVGVLAATTGFRLITTVKVIHRTSRTAYSEQRNREVKLPIIQFLESNKPETRLKKAQQQYSPTVTQLPLEPVKEATIHDSRESSPSEATIFPLHVEDDELGKQSEKIESHQFERVSNLDGRHPIEFSVHNENKATADLKSAASNVSTNAQNVMGSGSRIYQHSVVDDASPRTAAPRTVAVLVNETNVNVVLENNSTMENVINNPHNHTAKAKLLNNRTMDNHRAVVMGKHASDAKSQMEEGQEATEKVGKQTTTSTSQKQEMWMNVLEELIPANFKVFVYDNNPFLNWLQLFETGICKNPIYVPAKVISGSKKKVQSSAAPDERMKPHSLLEWWSRYWHSDDLHFARAITSEAFKKSRWYTSDPSKADLLAVPALLNLFYAPPSGYRKVECSLTVREIVGEMVKSLSEQEHFHHTRQRHYFSFAHFHFRRRGVLPPELLEVLRVAVGSTFENTVAAVRCGSAGLYVPYPCGHETEAGIRRWFVLPEQASALVPRASMAGAELRWEAGKSCFEDHDCGRWEGLRPIDFGFRGRVDGRRWYSNRREYCRQVRALGLARGLEVTCISTAPLHYRPPIRIKHKVSAYEGIICGPERTAECTATDGKYKLEYCTELLSSKFTAFVRGDTLTSNRLLEAMQAGSFPVLILNEDEPALPYLKVHPRGVPWSEIWFICRLGSQFNDCMNRIYSLDHVQLLERFQLMKKYAQVIDFWVGGGLPASLFQMYQVSQHCEAPLEWIHKEGILKPVS